MIDTPYSHSLHRLKNIPEGDAGGRMRALLDLEHQAAEKAKTAQGKISVLADADRCLRSGNSDVAAILHTAADAAMETPQSVSDDTYPTRVADAEAAEKLHREWEDYYHSLATPAFGHAAAGVCEACHHAHTEGECTGIGIPGSGGCHCATHHEPPPQRVAAHEAYLTYLQAQDTAKEKMSAANLVVRGDRFVATGGTEIPLNTAGSVVRAHNGNYGLRVLLHTDAGTEEWVSMGNLVRDSAGHVDKAVSMPKSPTD